MPHARTTDPITSHMAADSIKAPTQTQHVILLILERIGPATDEEIWTEVLKGRQSGVPEYFMSPSRARTARHELVEALLAERDEAMGVTALGNKSHKWRLTQRAKQIPLWA